MFLKSIEIRGFKSFADKTELSFKKGVTAVVGPNGSGKSNISDAIRWVLGEQSVKTLRGGKMEDVIFAGTQFRKPVGLAQVSLTLDNSEGELPLDYSDVTISRRLYRNGDSEYLINNNSCRLKDVQELFMDTGIGKEGYSIIGQGKIDAILSGKPDERRALLEEAAGIVKFKSRKLESEKKLQSTEQNLVRLDDIILAMEERLEPLEIDSKKAKEFLELSNEQRGLEISLIIHSISQLSERIKAYENELNKSEDEKKHLSEDSEKLKKSLQEINAEIEIEEHSFSEEKNKFYEFKELIQKLNGDIVVLEERINNAENSLAKNNLEIEVIEEKIAQLKEIEKGDRIEIESLLEEKKSYESKICDLEKKIYDFNKESTILEEDSKNFRELSIEILRNIAKCNNEKTSLKSDIDNLDSKVLSLREQSDNYKNNLEINKTTTLLLEEEKDKTYSDINLMNEKVKENKKLKNSLLNEISNMEGNLKTQSAQINKFEANHNMLMNLERDYEGYNKSVKNLMQHIEENKIGSAKGKVFVLGEILEVEKKFEVAIDIALGAAVSNIITSDELMAKNLINYLKEKNLGRATFLPLSIIQGKKLNLNSNITSLKGFLGIASDVVNYNKLYEKAITSVLGRTIICDTMNTALNIAKYTNHSYKIVTLDGEVINPGGSMTGGSIYKKATNVLGRKREIKELEEKIQALLKKQYTLEKSLEDKKREFKALDDEFLNLRDDIHHKNIEMTKIQERILSLRNENKKLEDNIVTSDRESRIIEKKIIELKNKLDEKEKELKHLENSEEKNKKDIILADEKKQELIKNLESEKEVFTKLKIEKAQLDEVISAKKSNANRNLSDLKEAINKSSEIKKEISESDLIKSESSAFIEKKKSDILDYENKIKELESAFESYEKKRFSLKESLSKFTDNLEDINSLIRKNEEEISKLGIAKAKYEIEMQGYLTKLNEDMNLTLAEAEDLAERDIDVQGTKTRISALKGKISSLGNVNLGAIEEYKEVSSKYEFMCLQREDLEKSKKELLNVIEEMTCKMKDMFNENFQKLREYFNETFRELFKGGRADLILGEGDELSANIEINVEPPGKKLQNINLMSGGEKVLSAIALLFAILKMKPTPFCILDEIEAALDDANVFRYASFLKEFSSNIQFIVITHRKGTMEASDVMYGVTMEEKGVSKIISVDLSA
ncbi:MAG: chromosome segregation protein SMC [Clostridium sp.]|uniref:chromosome segregation protein SMC n=1 Tax=Clostridium sp. TaxID=1506 RepID=UPI002A8E8239|nr:chromosome segregation protein SMC [Clostridium sp.]MDY5098149.1 chromosome segregation protein SMC [Clostridium sp.]